ncbi:hypothetical protein V8E54_006129 [Elaphomyces granulatus]
MSESSLNKGGHGATLMQPDEIADAEVLTLLDAGTTKSPTLPTPMRGGRKPGSKNTKPSSSQKPEVYNQHFPTLSDDEEKRLDQYIKAIREFSPYTNLDRQYNQ